MKKQFEGLIDGYFVVFGIYCMAQTFYSFPLYFLIKYNLLRQLCHHVFQIQHPQCKWVSTYRCHDRKRRKKEKGKKSHDARVGQSMEKDVPQHIKWQGSICVSLQHDSSGGIGHQSKLPEQKPTSFRKIPQLLNAVNMLFPSQNMPLLADSVRLATHPACPAQQLNALQGLPADHLPSRISPQGQVPRIKCLISFQSIKKFGHVIPSLASLMQQPH